MQFNGKVATWLEVIAAPQSRETRATPRLHPILGRGSENCNCSPETCYAVSVEGRWLCSNNGRLTVLRGLPAARRFIRLVRLGACLDGEPAEFEFDCATTAHCIALGKDQSLQSCKKSLAPSLA